MLTLVGCGEEKGAEADTNKDTITQQGVECYREDGVCYPAVFGKPQLTMDEISALLEGGDPAEMAAEVETLPDALRLLKTRQKSSEGISDQDAETTLLQGSDQPRGWVEALLYLLEGDYEESGYIELSGETDGFCFAAIKMEGLYYAFDAFDISGDSWIPFSGEGYADADVQKVVDALLATCTYNTYQTGSYQKRAEKQAAADGETQEGKLVSTQGSLAERKYTDAEIQALVDADISFAEACEKISTVADAAKFLEMRGYSFAPDDAGTGAALRYQLNSGACVGTSALFGALLNGDYDEVGYVYVFWLESEHVFNYVRKDGVYYACDFIYGPVKREGTDANRSCIRYTGADMSGLFEKYAQQEGDEIGSAVAIMYTTAYSGDPTMPSVWLRDSEDGHHATIWLSEAERASQQILLLRDGYTFTF